MEIEKIGQKIKNKRVALGLTQKDLAQAINVSGQLISKWETGESIPTLEYMDLLCAALKTDMLYFLSPDGDPDSSDIDVEGPDTRNAQDVDTQRGESDRAAEQAEPTSAPVETERTVAEAPDRSNTHGKPSGKKYSKRKRIGLIVGASVAAALIVVTIILLVCLVFVPMGKQRAAERKRAAYISDIQNACDKYVDRGYYNVIMSTSGGGTELRYTYKGYMDPDGEVAFSNTQTGMTYVDGIVTLDKYPTLKYKYTPPTFSTFEEFMRWQIFGDADADGFDSTDDMESITKTATGYSVVLADEYFTAELDDAVKENVELADKIRGEIVIENGVIGKISVTVEVLYKAYSVRVTNRSTFEFVSVRPVIENKNLANREWADENSDPTKPIDPVPAETVYEPKSAEEFAAALGGGKATKANIDNTNSSLMSGILNGSLAYGDGYFYTVSRCDVTLYSPQDLSVVKTIKLDESDSTLDNIHISGGKIYFTKYTYDDSEKKPIFATDIATGERKYITYIYAKAIYNGKYAIFMTENSYSKRQYCVRDLDRGLSFDLDSRASCPFVDSRGNVYYSVALSEILFIANREYYGEYYWNVSDPVKLNGDMYYAGSWSSEAYKHDGDAIYTRDDIKVYKYEYGKIIGEYYFSSSALNDGCVEMNGAYVVKGYGSEVYDLDGTVKVDLGKNRIEVRDGDNTLGMSVTRIYGATDDKIVVRYLFGYFGVIALSDPTVPLCLIHTDYESSYFGSDPVIVSRIGNKTAICVRNTDNYAYDYSVWLI